MLEIEFRSQRAETSRDLKNGDIFIVNNDKTHVHLVLESARVLDLSNGKLHIVADFSGFSLQIAKKAHLTLEF